MAITFFNLKVILRKLKVFNEDNKAQKARWNLA